MIGLCRQNNWFLYIEGTTILKRNSCQDSKVNHENNLKEYVRDGRNCGVAKSIVHVVGLTYHAN
jgi:predicted peroxiredoxin